MNPMDSMDPMKPVMDFDTLRRAMADNHEQPEGPARNARAEVLLAEAERLGTPLAVIEALGHQLKVYNYSSEKDKMFVPFARLLRLWDEHPEDFDEYEIHTLHWVFKWMTAGMLGQPHIPLAAVEKWLGEMEHRYRLAGHSERAVRNCEFSVASHIGDLDRADRAYTAWLAADRDSMADCHACELHDQGWWQAHRGNDAEALALWAPVLDGTHACAHEPHAVLASSLLPLLRLGRVDEARAHHLRGLRLVRPMESMRGSYAAHVEFCALTGNEARGLELLAEPPGVLHRHRRAAQPHGLPGRRRPADRPPRGARPRRADRAGARRPGLDGRRPRPPRARGGARPGRPLRRPQRHPAHRGARPWPHGPTAPAGPAAARRALPAHRAHRAHPADAPVDGDPVVGHTGRGTDPGDAARPGAPAVRGAAPAVRAGLGGGGAGRRGAARTGRPRPAPRSPTTRRSPPAPRAPHSSSGPPPTTRRPATPARPSPPAPVPPTYGH
ncbi:hypothetical protein QFZ64_004951 [Streptomyces sp. B3I8]|nr:hypothetical protein [Streptomyces sp. B3I8]